MNPETNERQSLFASRCIVSFSFQCHSDPSTCQHGAHHMWSKAIGLPVSLSERKKESNANTHLLCRGVSSDIAPPAQRTCDFAPHVFCQHERFAYDLAAQAWKCIRHICVVPRVTDIRTIRASWDCSQRRHGIECGIIVSIRGETVGQVARLLQHHDYPGHLLGYGESTSLFCSTFLTDNHVN